MSDLNATGTAPLGTQLAALNSTSFYGGDPGGCKVRLVSLGCRVTYEGTDQQRAGKITAGLVANTDAVATVATTGTLSSAASGYFTTPVVAMTDVRNAMVEAVEARISDGIFDVHWEPNGVPSYQNFSTVKVTSNAPSAGTSYVAGGSRFQQEKGGSGPEIGQNALVIMIENDTTISSLNIGNTYGFEMVWNWEVVPDAPPSIIYSLTPSYCQLSWLQDAINTIQDRTLGGYRANASTYGPKFYTESLGANSTTRLNPRFSRFG